jgi:hypothetical protein
MCTNAPYVESEQSVAIKTLVRCRQGFRCTCAAVARLVKGKKERLANTAVARRGRGGPFAINDIQCLYLALLLSDFSVNVIANPVNVAPIPNPIVQVPTNISMTAWGAWL